MCNQNLWIFLKHSTHRGHGHTTLAHLNHLQIAGAHDAIGLICCHQLNDVDLRAAHFDGHIQAILFVNTSGNSLVKTAMFSLCIPVGHVGEFFLRLHRLKTGKAHESNAQACAHCCSGRRFEAEMFQDELLNVKKLE